MPVSCLLNEKGARSTSGDHALIMSIDAGMTPGPRNSFSVIQVWCAVGGNHYLFDQWREQCDFKSLECQVRLFFKRSRHMHADLHSAGFWVRTPHAERCEVRRARCLRARVRVAHFGSGLVLVLRLKLLGARHGDPR